MKISTEIRQLKDGRWYVRLVSGRSAFANIRPTREEALRQVVRGLRWIQRRAA